MFGPTKHRKWFSGKRFPRQPNSGKQFPFPEISISGKYEFSGNRFTTTKRTLKIPCLFSIITHFSSLNIFHTICGPHTCHRCIFYIFYFFYNTQTHWIQWKKKKIPNIQPRKRKMYLGCLAVSKIVLQKINSGVWFVQTFYGKCFTENQFPCLVRSNILRKMKFVFYGKSIPVLVCGSFYRKYEMCYKFKHLHYLDKPVTVQN